MEKKKYWKNIKTVLEILEIIKEIENKNYVIHSDFQNIFRLGQSVNSQFLVEPSKNCSRKRLEKRKCLLSNTTKFPE